MPLQSRLPRLAAFLLLASCATCLLAQSPAPIPAPIPAPVNPDITPSLSHLADQPASHTGFTFDRTMLEAARTLLEANGMDARRAAVALSSISYENYHYPEPPVYSTGAMDSIRAAYHAAGWKHLVNARDPAAPTSPNREAPASAPTHRNQATDLWLHVNGANIDGITVLTRGVKNVNVVQVACDLRPLDLIGLSGHFGIPKVDANAVMIPAPDNR
jgi:hypothetical protein